MAVAKVFLDVNMGLGIPGLTKLLEENRIAVKAAHTDTMFMFLNRNRNQVKILWHERFMLHFRKSEDAITIDELKKIPNYFKAQIITGKIETQLAKFINKKTNVTIDEDGLNVS